MLSFAGIDLTSSPKRLSAYSVLEAGPKVKSLGFLSTDSEIIAAIEHARPMLVAIDAPLSLPRGLCCLNESCTCRSISGGKGRLCERELAIQGIPCYFTSKKSIIKEMAYRAIDLKKELLARGIEVIEVYPYASKVKLWEKPIPKKSMPEGLQFLKDRLATMIPNITQAQLSLSHDLCDAVIAAYTAYLHHLGKTEVVGDPDEGLIYVPCAIRRLQRV